MRRFVKNLGRKIAIQDVKAVDDKIQVKRNNPRFVFGGVLDPFEIWGANLRCWMNPQDMIDIQEYSCNLTDVGHSPNNLWDSNPNCVDSDIKGYNGGSTTNSPTLLCDDLNGQATVEYDSAGDYLFIDNNLGANKNFDYLHDGSSMGVCVIAYVSPSNPDDVYTFFSNTARTTAKRGIHITYEDRVSQSANNRITVLVTRGSGGTTCYSFDGDDVLLPQVWNWIWFEYDASGDAYKLFVNGSQVDTAPVDSAHSASAASDPMHLGAASTVDAKWDGKIANFFTVDAFDATKRQQTFNWIQSTFAL